MQIGFVASEMFPFSKTGGLADVAAALPKALAAAGHEVRVFTPLYSQALAWLAQHGGAPEAHRLIEYLWIGDHQRQVEFREVEHDGMRVVFVQNDWAFDRPGLYLSEGRDYPDNVGRFALFSRAVLEYCLQHGYAPDVLHCNDWQSALVPVYLKTTYQRAQLASIKTVLTIHNLGYQGIFPAEEIYSTGLGWEYFNPEMLEFHGQLNLLKGGIVFADAVTTVSPSYAKEIQTHEHGMALEGLIKYHKDKLTGILNGIDTQVWDPAADPVLPARYSLKNLKGKATNKKALQQRLGQKTDPDAFLLGMVSRFDRQKGVDLALEAVARSGKLNVQLALLGAGDPLLQERAAQLSMENAGRVGVQLGYDEELAHLIYAGADALLMPSQYEPCGLNQMYAQRYGTVPIVRETGGLKDTVARYSPLRAAKGTATGFTFKPFTVTSLASEIKSAYKLFNDKDKWVSLVRTIMQLDRSWDRSAKEYVMLYRKLVKRATPEQSNAAEASA
jgi:starch synthase